MDFFYKVIQTFRKPFPEVNSFGTLFKHISAVSIFITLFLYVFQPNEVRYAETSPFLICLGFGIITFVTSFTYDFIVTNLLRLKAKGKLFTFGHWIIYILGVLLCIGCANFLYSSYLTGVYRWELLFEIITNTFIISIIPMVALGAVVLWNQEKKYLMIAYEINQKGTHESKLNSTDDVVIFNISASQIRYIEALQNYVKIGYVNSDNQLVEQTERATLKSILTEAKENSIVKCHRSYLVNQETIVSTSGNAQGLLLTLSNCDKIIPVSRSFVPAFRN